MQDDSKPADVALAMTTLLRYQQRAGRFGRAVPSEDPETDETRTAMAETERTEAVAYAVDPDAVAAAIVTRLLAGRTLTLPE
jgi:hypothetical protein